MSTFRVELENLVNKYSLENGCGMPDYIIAEYLISCIKAFSEAIKENEARFYVGLQSSNIK